MVDVVTKEASSCDIKELVQKLIPDSIGKEIDKATRGIFPMKDVVVRKVKILKAPKLDITKLMEVRTRPRSRLAARTHSPPILELASGRSLVSPLTNCASQRAYRCTATTPPRTLAPRSTGLRTRPRRRLSAPKRFVGSRCIASQDGAASPRRGRAPSQGRTSASCAPRRSRHRRWALLETSFRGSSLLSFYLGAGPRALRLSS